MQGRNAPNVGQPIRRCERPMSAKGATNRHKLANVHNLRIVHQLRALDGVPMDPRLLHQSQVQGVQFLPLLLRELAIFNILKGASFACDASVDGGGLLEDALGPELEEDLVVCIAE